MHQHLHKIGSGAVGSHRRVGKSVQMDRGAWDKTRRRDERPEAERRAYSVDVETYRIFSSGDHRERM